MSIFGFPALAAAADTASIVNGVLLAVSMAALLAAWFVGLARPGGVQRAPRIPENSSALPLAAVLFGAVACSMFADMGVERIWYHFHPGAQPGSIINFDSGLALLATIPQLIGLVTILAGDALVFKSVGQHLGLVLRRLPGGAAVGLVGAVIIIPPLFLLSAIVEKVYQNVHFQHPAEHPLLRALGEGPGPLVQGAIIIGACLIAPLWEEIVFRGHIQTLLKRMLEWLAPQLGLRPHRPLANGLAILMTSALFMLMHQGWEWPVIFVLAVCLGYAYERTGNLWVSITLHAAFNTVSTVLFLVGTGSR
jgi:membrane protease YdiL (CAAX protease family)